jgi:hypothetical protein
MRSMSATDAAGSMPTVLFAAAAFYELRHRVLPWSSGWSVRIDGLLLGDPIAHEAGTGIRRS